MAAPSPARLDAGQIENLIHSLAARGYDVVGPTIRDGAIVYDTIAGVRDLPTGRTDKQEAGQYRIESRCDGSFFGYTLGPQSWKKYLHPAQVKLFEAEQKQGQFRILNGVEKSDQKFAFIGVRACELAAIRIQDRVLLDGPYRDPIYKARRAGIFLVAVQCTQSASTCFCESLGTGPRVQSTGFDLKLTEIVDAEEHWFLAEAWTDRGREVLAELDPQPASEKDRAMAHAAGEAAAAQQTRRIDIDDVRQVLYRNFEHPRWEQIAQRCLSCGNCTMVCPTCFCTTVEDVSDVTGEHAERWRKWDSCFTVSFSFIHGGSVRTSEKSRYRQWMTHKLASWIDQFGSPGCVGCGRCIAWCPAGIDITEELEAIRGAATHGNTDA